MADRERRRWADLVNTALQRAGFDARVDHRSLADQGIEKLPTVHLGSIATRMERRGLRTDRGDMSRDAEEQNSRLETIIGLIAAMKDSGKA